MAANPESFQPAETWCPAYVGIGSNLADPVAQVRNAIAELAALDDVCGVLASPLYANPPMGPQDQPDYVNAVAGLLTRLPPLEFLAQLQAIEQSMGRVRKADDRWGPRVIDLDLLLHGATEMVSDGLNLPHSGISERNFVLLPLCDIAPLLVVPGQGAVKLLAAKLAGDSLQRI